MISLLVVERGTPGFEVSRQLDKMGWRSSDTAELSYVDARVPVGNLVGDAESGFVQIALAFVTERIALAVQGYATAARCLELATTYAREREAFGQRLVDNQVVRHKLVEMHRQVDAARVYTREVARRYDAGEQPLVEALHAKRLGVAAATYCTLSCTVAQGWRPTASQTVMPSAWSASEAINPPCTAPRAFRCRASIAMPCTQASPSRRESSGPISTEKPSACPKCRTSHPCGIAFIACVIHICCSPPG